MGIYTVFENLNNFVLGWAYILFFIRGFVHFMFIGAFSVDGHIYCFDPFQKFCKKHYHIIDYFNISSKKISGQGYKWVSGSPF